MAWVVDHGNANSIAVHDLAFYFGVVARASCPSPSGAAMMSRDKENVGGVVLELFIKHLIAREESNDE